jgi:multiple sugar transport system permease protein
MSTTTADTPSAGAAVMAKRSWRIGRKISDAIWWWACQLLLIAILVVIAFPFYWTVVTTLKTKEEQFAKIPTFLPHPITLDNYKWVFQHGDFMRALRNSLILAPLGALGSVVLTTTFGYSLARYRYPGKKWIITFLVATQMLPGVLTIVPLFVVFSKLKLVNTYLGLLLGYWTFSVPFSGMMLRGFFNNFPVELEEAALIDGCSRLGAFIKITLPLTIPGIVTVALFSFIGVWNDLLFALVLTRDLDAMTATVFLSNMITQQYSSTNWGGMIAIGSVLTIPTVIFFVFLQKAIITGMTAGAIKG